MRATWIIFALAAATLVFVMILRPGAPGPSSEDVESVAPGSVAERSGVERSNGAGEREAARGERVDTTPRTEVEPQEESERPSGGYDRFGAAFHASDDYYAFVQDALQAADQGDAAASYYIARILEECRLAVRQFDGEYPDDTTLSMAVPDELNPGINDLMQEQVARCRGFFDDDMALYGDPDQWMKQAAENGHGPAVMRKGINDYRMYQAGRSDDFDPGQLVEVLRERNPDTLSYASQFSAIHGASRVDESAWLMLACEYGQDCSADADWVKALCLQEGCPPSFDSGEDALSILLSPGEMDQARDRMQELERALDEGDFDALFR